MGCTEPIAVAYAAAAARELLGGMPDKVKVGVSDNIIKNVKSVVVPNTDGMRGIESAAVAGILGFYMYQNGQQFKGGEGIVTKGVEATIRNVGQFGREQKRSGLVLTCKEKLIPYYSKFGFVNEGVSESVHGNVIWYQMRLTF